MEIRLLKEVSLEKVNKVLDFCKLLNDVRRCNDILHMEREEYEWIVRDNRELSCRSNFQNEPPSHHIPNQNNNPAAPPSSATNSAPCKQCPKLLDGERKLLND